MRPTLTLGLLAVAIPLSAQLQNGGFEDLSSFDMPAYWTTGIELISIGDSVFTDSSKYLLNSTDVHSGQHAAELRNSYNYTQDHGSAGVWYATPFEEGYGGFPAFDVPVVERPGVVHFWAKYAPVEDDSAYVEVIVISIENVEIGFGSLRIGGDLNTYTAFEVPIDYTSTQEASTISIRFTTMVPGGNPHLGTRMLIDDVSVEQAAVGIEEHSGLSFHLFPNPASDHASIVVPSDQVASRIQVIDASGRVLREASARSTIETLDVADLPAGIYALNLLSSEGDEVLGSQRLVVSSDR